MGDITTRAHGCPTCETPNYVVWSAALLTPRSRVLLEKLTGFAAIKKFPVFYGTRKFITVLTSARHFCKINV